MPHTGGAPVLPMATLAPPAKHSAAATKQLLGSPIAKQLPNTLAVTAGRLLSTLNLPLMLVSIGMLAKGFPTQAN